MSLYIGLSTKSMALYKLFSLKLLPHGPILSFPRHYKIKHPACLSLVYCWVVNYTAHHDWAELERHSNLSSKSGNIREFSTAKHKWLNCSLAFHFNEGRNSIEAATNVTYIIHKTRTIYINISAITVVGRPRCWFDHSHNLLKQKS